MPGHRVHRLGGDGELEGDKTCPEVSLKGTTCLGDVFWEMETVGVGDTCLRHGETFSVLGHRPLRHGACGVSLTPVFISHTDRQSLLFVCKNGEYGGWLHTQAKCTHTHTTTPTTHTHTHTHPHTHTHTTPHMLGAFEAASERGGLLSLMWCHGNERCTEGAEAELI